MIKKILPFFIGITILFSLFYLLTHPQTSNPNQDIQNQKPTTGAQVSVSPKKDYITYDDPDLIFYFGDGCPHCENVEAWLSENNSENKVKVNSKEVYYDQQNQTDLYNIVKQYCPELIDNGGIGVPTAFDPVNQKCIQGDTPIIEFLSSKMSE